MNIKFADEIVKGMDARGKISVPTGYVTGEEFEKWLYGGIVENYSENENIKSDALFCTKKINNEYVDNYGDAA